MRWDHTVYLSDGTTLDGNQWDQLVKDGHLRMDDGRIIEFDPREEFYREGVLRAFHPKETT